MAKHFIITVGDFRDSSEILLLKDALPPSPKPSVTSHWRHLAQGVEVLATGLLQEELVYPTNRYRTLRILRNCHQKTPPAILVQRHQPRDPQPP